MASIRIVRVNNKEYIQVIAYEPGRGGHPRIKVLKSFGPNTTLNMIEAKIFLSNYNVLEKIKTDPEVNKVENMVTIEKVATAIAGSILGYKVIEYLFGKKDSEEKGTEEKKSEK